MTGSAMLMMILNSFQDFDFVAMYDVRYCRFGIPGPRPRDYSEAFTGTHLDFRFAVTWPAIAYVAVTRDTVSR
jgi:hypothetical protein